MPVSNEIIKEYKKALTTRCEEKGCKLVLDDLSNIKMLRGGKIQEYYGWRDKPFCDFIIFKFNESIFVGIVELKNTLDAKEIVRQLRNGTEFVYNAMKKHKNEVDTITIMLIALSNNHKATEVKRIRKSNISLANNDCPILQAGAVYLLRHYYMGIMENIER